MPDPSRRQWTPARCKRLLRPLISQLELIRNSSKLETSETIPDTTVILTPGILTRSKRDPDWIATADLVRKRQRIFGKRTTTAETEQSCPPRLSEPSLRPGEVTLETPYLARRKTLPPPFADFRAALDNVPRAMPDRATRDRVRQFQELYLKEDQNPQDDLIVAYGNIICETDEHEHLERLSTRKGTRSLMSTCLSLVPDYIEYHEDLLEDQGAEIEKIDQVFDDVYTELAAIGPIREDDLHLSEVTRAHATRLVYDAFAEGLLPPNYFWRLCQKHGRRLDGVEIVTKFASAIVASLQRFSANEQLCLYRLVLRPWKEISTRSFCNGLALGLEEGIITPRLISSHEFVQIWKELLRGLSTEASSDACGSQVLGYSIARLLFATILRVEQPQIQAEHTTQLWRGGTVLKLRAQFVNEGSYDATRNTIFSSTSLLVSMALLADGDLHTRRRSECSVACEWALQSVSLDIINELRACPSRLANRNFNSTRTDCATFPLAGTLILRACLHSAQSIYQLSFETLAEHLEDLNPANGSESQRWNRTRESIPGFICDVAKCCGRTGDSTDNVGLSMLKRIVNSLVAVSRKTDDDQTKAFLHKISLRSAKQYARYCSPSASALEYAKSIEDLVLSHSSASVRVNSQLINQNSTPSLSHYQWDDLIEEWVVALPWEVGGRPPTTINTDQLDVCVADERLPTSELNFKSLHSTFQHVQTPQKPDSVTVLPPSPSEASLVLRPRILGNSSSIYHDASWRNTRPDGLPDHMCRLRDGIGIPRTSLPNGHGRSITRQRRQQMRTISNSLLSNFSSSSSGLDQSNMLTPMPKKPGDLLQTPTGLGSSEIDEQRWSEEEEEKASLDKRSLYCDLFSKRKSGADSD